jgi:hypothetical protein
LNEALLVLPILLIELTDGEFGIFGKSKSENLAELPYRLVRVLVGVEGWSSSSKFLKSK